MTLRAAIVGTGFAAAAHADALRRLPGVEIAGLAGRTPERGAEVAAALGVAAFRRLDELLADESVDAVHDCTPNDLHLEVTAAALAAGKNVLTEKPLAPASEESAKLVRLAEEAAARGLVTGVCFNYRFYSVVLRMRELVAAGRIGPVHFVHGGYLQDWLLGESDWNWRVDPARGGASRAFADIGSHWCDLAEFLSGERISAVCADLGVVHGSRETEDFGSALVRFGSGARGAFSVSQVSAGRGNDLRIGLDGALASLSWSQEDPNRAVLGRRDEPSEVLVPERHTGGYADGFRDLCADFYAAVAAEPGERSFASFADGHHLVQVIEAILDSHRSSGWVDVA